jgi:hypothetical protein
MPATENQKKVLIKLTDEQRKAIRELTGKDAECIECTQDELEMKLAPCLPCEKHTRPRQGVRSKAPVHRRAPLCYRGRGTPVPNAASGRLSAGHDQGQL